MNNYDDIIDLDYQISTKHRRMSIESRAAQFAPFAALTGYNEAIKESSRLTDKKIEISDELKNILDYKLSLINKNDLVIITYFVKDNKKSGGEYKTIKNKIKKIDKIKKMIILNDNIKINIEDVISIKINDIIDKEVLLYQ